MLTKQKIKKLRINAIIMSAFMLICVFYNFLNPFIVDTLLNRFNLVTSNDNLLVHFIDVGQADAIAINLPDGKVMLIDNGSEYVNTSYVKYLKENVLNSKLNIDIDYLVLTHADSDHVGGTMKLLKNFNINYVFMPKIEAKTETFLEIKNYVYKNYKFKTLGNEFYIKNNGYSFTFFEILNNDDTNNSSQLIKLEYKNKSFLFTADISKEVENLYVERYKNLLDCDVLKVAHHGSKESTSQELINCVTPNFAVVSVRKNNLYGHPNAEVLNLLKLNDVGIFRTDKQGSILFLVGNDYDLDVVNGIYYITNLTLDYRIYIVVIELFLFVDVFVIIMKKDKRKNKN